MNLDTLSAWIISGFLMPFSIALVVTGLSIILARRLQIMAFPNERSSHIRPTPKFGGIGPVLTFIVFLLCLDSVKAFLPAGVTIFTVRSALEKIILAGGILAFIIGLYDDILGLSALAKLLGQVLVAIVPILFGTYLKEVDLPFLGVVSLGAAGIPVTFFWILFFINAFNFMDGMDGKAASFSVGVLATILLLFALPAASENVVLQGRLRPPLPLLSMLALIGALAGFLVYNYPSARTFMGDCGSQFLGFLLAAAAVYDGRHFLVFLILLLPFIYDVVYTLIRRWRRSENLLQAHRSHLYQRLMITGYSHWTVLRICEVTYICCAACSAVYFFAQTSFLRILSILCALLTMIVYNLFVLYKEKQRIGSVD